MIPDHLREPVAPLASVQPVRPYERYRVSVEEYVTFRAQGFLIVRGLVPPEDVAEMRAHSEDVMAGRITIPGVPPIPADATPEEREKFYLRVHMLHRVLAIHERFLLHPRILDVLEALIGPDVMAMQSMFFFKFPGGDGQGYHQDSYYIPTVPDTLCGAWLAIDGADPENGGLWFTPGSQHEPIYPTAGQERANHGSSLNDLPTVTNVSDPDTERNTLARIATKYAGQEVSAIAEPGDVVFFGGHIFHRSHRNMSASRFRRSFVGHYANARSFTAWDYGYDSAGALQNGQHILARGDTHLPYAQPRFGTACAANTPELRLATASAGVAMMGGDDGLMGPAPLPTEPADETED